MKLIASVILTLEAFASNDDSSLLQSKVANKQSQIGKRDAEVSDNNLRSTPGGSWRAVGSSYAQECVDPRYEHYEPQMQGGDWEEGAACSPAGRAVSVAIDYQQGYDCSDVPTYQDFICEAATEVAPVPSGPSLSTLQPTLFFSQYLEGSWYNKYLQVYNPTDLSIDLRNGYSIGACTNGCSSNGVFEKSYRFASGATIAARGTYTVCNSGLSDKTGCDEVEVGNKIAGFNGNDVRALVSGIDATMAASTDILDVIGKVVVSDPGSKWDVCGTVGSTKNTLLTRSSATCVGTGYVTGAESMFDDSFLGTCTWQPSAMTSTVAVWTGGCGSSTTPATVPITWTKVVWTGPVEACPGDASFTPYSQKSPAVTEVPFGGSVMVSASMSGGCVFCYNDGTPPVVSGGTLTQVSGGIPISCDDTRWDFALTHDGVSSAVQVEYYVHVD